LIVRCLRCAAKYEPRRASEHFCETCSQARKREQDRERKRERYEAGKTAVEGLPSRCAEWAADLTHEHYEEIGLALENGDPSLVLDKMPDGANSPAGPDEGRSSFFLDLREWLDILSGEAAEHPWWKENPHALFEVHAPEKAALYNLAPGPTCGDQRGTRAGYKRHKRANEMACPPCSEANTAYFQSYRVAA
jgi:hypothetical protein